RSVSVHHSSSASAFILHSSFSIHHYSASSFPMIPFLPLIARRPRRRKRRERKLPSAGPSADNAILSVDHLDAFHLAATMSPGAGVLDVVLPQGLQAMLLGVWVDADNVDVSDPLRPVFVFLDPMDDANQWRVPQPAAWAFANGQPLAGPYEGEIG